MAERFQQSRSEWIYFFRKTGTKKSNWENRQKNCGNRLFVSNLNKRVFCKQNWKFCNCEKENLDWKRHYQSIKSSVRCDKSTIWKKQKFNVKSHSEVKDGNQCYWINWSAKVKVLVILQLDSNASRWNFRHLNWRYRS